MDINVTAFLTEDAAPRDYSASAAELGQDAGAITWRHAMEDSEEDGELFFLADEDSRAAFREYVAGFGAWEDEEINGWDNRQLNALFLQMVAGDIRDAQAVAGEPIDWRLYQEAAERGETSGSLYYDEEDARLYFYIGV